MTKEQAIEINQAFEQYCNEHGVSLKYAGYSSQSQEAKDCYVYFIDSLAASQFITQEDAATITYYPTNQKDTVMSKQYAVLTVTVCGEPEDCWREDGELRRFHSEAEAQTAINEFLDDIIGTPLDGVYDKHDFTIKEI